MKNNAIGANEKATIWTMAKQAAGATTVGLAFGFLGVMLFLSPSDVSGPILGMGLARAIGETFKKLTDGGIFVQLPGTSPPSDERLSSFAGTGRMMSGSPGSKAFAKALLEIGFVFWASDPKISVLTAEQWSAVFEIVPINEERAFAGANIWRTDVDRWAVRYDGTIYEGPLDATAKAIEKAQHKKHTQNAPTVDGKAN